jgi:hypothetical protein
MNGTQLRAMLWLRWRLTLNQWRRGGAVSAAVAMIFSIIGLGLALCGGIAGVAIGATGLSTASPQVSLLVWDGLVAAFLLFWTTGIVTELQRSEIIDLSRLLHLPVSLRDVFLLNYAASHLSLSLAMMLPAMLGLTAGLVLGRGAMMMLLLPLVCGFFFMITAWTYCLRGWLAGLMVNKRRRRAIIMGVTMAFVLLAQLPNLMTNFWFRGRHTLRPTPATVNAPVGGDAAEARTVALLDVAHRYVPLLWLPEGARALTEGRAWPAIGCALGMLAMGAWGLARAYRGTLRFYRGGDSKKRVPPPSVVPATHAARKILVERTLPAIPEEAAALALASFRGMSRAPEVKMALATNVVIFAILGASILMRRTGAMPAMGRPFVAAAAVAVALLGLAQMMFNQFGFDRGGFRAIVLLPTPRRHILLGKNLALLPVALLVFAIYLGLAAVLAHLRVWDILTAVCEFAGAFAAMSVLGNLASILLPYRITPGSLKPTKISGTTHLLVIVTHLLFPLAVLPIFLPAALAALGGTFPWLPGSAIALACAVVLAILSGVLYWRTLAPMGRLLQRRERNILQRVTQEVE